MPGSTSPRWWELIARYRAWRARVWRERLGVDSLERALSLQGERVGDLCLEMFDQKKHLKAIAEMQTAQDGYWKERFGITTLEQPEHRSQADLGEIAYWRDHLGIIEIERELVLFKACIHDGVIAEPGRTILKEWRRQQRLMADEAAHYVAKHGKLAQDMRTMR